MLSAINNTDSVSVLQKPHPAAQQTPNVEDDRVGKIRVEKEGRSKREAGPQLWLKKRVRVAVRKVRDG